MSEVDSLFHPKFQVYFNLVFQVLLTVLSLYLFTIGHKQYLNFEGGPPKIRLSSTIATKCNKIHGAIFLIGYLFQDICIINYFVLFSSYSLTATNEISFDLCSYS